jgi:nuclear transport factor 2 (NTF2) superfamily protein
LRGGPTYAAERRETGGQTSGAPFNEETARQKVKAAQDAWNTRDPEKVALAYTEDPEVEVVLV